MYVNVILNIKWTITMYAKIYVEMVSELLCLVMMEIS